MLSFFIAGILTPLCAAESERPNILFIYTADHSYRTVSAYPQAYPWVKTPTIDRLAREGVRFESAYIGTWCMPSRATLLTGHHQFGVESMRMGGAVPRQRLRSRPVPLLAQDVSRQRILHGPHRQMAHGRRHRIRPRLGLPDRLEPAPVHSEPSELLLRPAHHLSGRGDERA